MSIESDIYNRSIGQGSGSGLQYSPETEELLQAALQHGGAVSQIAAEMAHPNGSFISMAKHKLGQSFTFAMDTLAIPSNAVAAMMDSDLTFEEARQKHITPSDIFFRDTEKPTTALGKVGDFGARLVVDVLLDPLTYVTFGTSSGLLGVTKLTSIPLKAATAKKLGLATTAMVDATGAVAEEAVRHRSVSEAGLKQLQKITSHVEDTIKRDTLDSFYNDTNIRGRLSRVVENLRGKDEKHFTDFMSKSEGAEYIVAEKLKNVYKGVDLTNPAQSADSLRFAEQVAVKEAMDEQARRLVQQTLAARRADIEDDAKRLMSNIIEKNVEAGGVVLDKLGNPIKNQVGVKAIRDLAKEWIDKGGVKVFGHSIIAGARIRATLGLIPFVSHVDKYTQGVRAIAASLVSTKYNSEGRIPDTLLKIQQRAKETKDAKMNEVFSFVPALYSKLGITEEEDKIISQAIGESIPPARGGDERLFTLWSLLRSERGQALAQEIADGKYGDDMPRMWRAATALKGQISRNLISMHEAGIAAYPRKNHIPGVLNQQSQIRSPFAKFKTSKAVNAEKAELVKWRNVEKPEEVIYGTEESLQLERLNKAEEKLRIEKEIQDAVIENEARKNKITGEIEKLWNSLAEKQVKAIIKGSKPVKEATEDTFNYEALERVIREAVPAVDRKRILQSYAKTYYKDGYKLTNPTTMSAEDILALKEDMMVGDDELDSIARYITANLDDFGIKVTPAPAAGLAEKSSKTAYDKKLAELMGIVMESGIEGKKQYLKKALGEDFNKIISGLSDEWHNDPGAISRTMEAILGKEFQLSQLMEDLSDVKNGLTQELKSPGLKRVAGRWFYKDKKEKVYERLEATAKQINENYFDSEEMFTESALKATLVSSENALRASASRNAIDDIAKSFGVPKSAAPSDFVQLGIAGLQKEAIDLEKFIKLENGALSIKNAEGEELYFHPTVAQAVNDMLKVLSEDPGSQLMAQSYDRLTNIWKASVTSIWPAFHGRNAISNVFQHMMDIGAESLNPVNHIIASRLIHYSNDIEKLSLQIAEGDAAATRKLYDLQSKYILTDKRGHRWTVGEMVTVAKNNAIAFNPNIIGQMDVMHSSRDMVDFIMDDLYPRLGEYSFPKKKYAMMANPFSQRFLPFRVGRSVGNYIEWQSRLVDFTANLRKTGDVEQSAFQTKQFLFDYQNLTPFERNFMRRIIPFYTWTRKNIEMQVQTLLTKPGRIGVFNHGIQAVGDVWGMGSLSQEERDMLPEWMVDSLNVVIGREGNKLTLLTTLGTPFEAPFQQLGNLMGSINPLIKAPVEGVTGYSFFNGKALSEVTNATAFSGPFVPEVLKDFIGYTEVKYSDKSGKENTLFVSLKPENMNLFNNLPFTPRTLSTLKLLETQNVPDQIKTLQLLFGIKPYEVDLEKEAARRSKELQSQLEELLDKAGLGYQFTRFQLTE